MSKTAQGLVKYAKAQIGRPYWYGTFGQKATKSLYEAKKKQYPKYYTSSDFSKQYGNKVHDCIGLIKGYIWCDDENDFSPKYQSNGCPDINEQMMYENAKVKGNIDTMPDEEGLLVFKNNHVGVYIGGGFVVQAKGHNYGVVKTKLDSDGWTKWCECPYIAYKNKAHKTDKYVTVKTNGSDLNCRNKARITGKVIGLFNNGTRLELIEKTRKNWYLVKGKAKSGKTVSGYCSAKWLK